MKVTGTRAHGDPDHKQGNFIIAVVALIVALGTGITSYLQYRAAVKAIQVSHQDSDKTFKQSNRAYVGAQATVVATKQGGRPVQEVTLHFTTVGPSPAADVRVWRRCATGQTSKRTVDGVNAIVPPEEIWSKLVPAVADSVLFPGNGLDFHCSATTGDEANAGDSASPFVFAAGYIQYKDVFGDVHKTTFCFETSVNSQNTPVAMLPCSEGNRIE